MNLRRTPARSAARKTAPRSRAPQLPPAPEPASSSLAFTLLQAARLQLAVMEGENLTASFERMLAANPDWPESSRAAIRHLAWTSVRAYGRADAILRQLLAHPPAESIHALLQVALIRLEQRPEQAHTTVDQAVVAAQVLMPGLKAMVNGVLRNALRQRESWADWRAAELDAVHAHPRWWIERVRQDHPAVWESVLAAGNTHPPMSVRINQRRSKVTSASAALATQGIETTVCGEHGLLLAEPVPVRHLPGFAEGLLSVQDAGAQQAAILLDAQPGERVLDACAAPGGKTAHILERAEVELLALELDSERAGRVKANLQRLGLQAELKVADCTQLEQWWDGRPFDRILADVPCSGSGVVRRHPDIKWLRREADIAQFAATQAQILDALWQTLKPGGTMLYVTCSVFAQENQAQIDHFLRRHGDARQAAIAGQPDFQLLPAADHDGFYFARLHKKK
jgi:16S rRNA (cytosine967-C5)-methyltransferase